VKVKAGPRKGGEKALHKVFAEEADFSLKGHQHREGGRYSDSPSGGAQNGLGRKGKEGGQTGIEKT